MVNAAKLYALIALGYLHTGENLTNNEHQDFAR